MCDHGTLTTTDAVNLAAIIGAAQRNAKVARLMDDGNVIYGMARSIGTDGGAFDFKSDARGQFLRVTTRMGMEVFWPVRELMADYQATTFVLDYEPTAGS